MKVLVTGAAGFIGSSLVERLLERGDEVTGVDIFDDFYAAATKRANVARALRAARYRLVEADIRDETAMLGVLREREPDVVVHLAARAGVRPSLEKAPLYADVNVRGTTVLLETCRQLGVRRFVFASSSSVYGARPSEPFREDDAVDRPVSPYAATKRAGEILAYTYHWLYGFDITCLRFFTVYGPRQRPEMAIHAFTRQIDEGHEIHVYGDGRAQRDFTYIDDIVDGIEAAIEKLEGYHIYNLGGGATIEVRDVIRRIEAALGKTARVRYDEPSPGDVPNTLADVQRAREELGYSPRVPVAEGIDRFVSWYLAQHGEHGESESRNERDARPQITSAGD